MCSCLATCSCFQIKRRNETLKMGTTYFSPSFLISSPLKYLSKYEVQKGVQGAVEDQRARSTPFGFHDMSRLGRVLQARLPVTEIISKGKELLELVCSKAAAGVLS